MASTISIAPMETTGAGSSFILLTDGFVQGTFLDDPAIRYQLEGGIVSTSQSTPLWGGLPLKLTVPTPNATLGSSGLGPTIVIADSLADINAWACINQAPNGIISPSSNAPQYASGMTMNFMRSGSNARMVLPVKAADVATIAGGNTAQNLYWDPTNLYVTVTSGGNYGPLVVQTEFLNQNSLTVTYTSGTKATTWNRSGSVIVVRV